VNLEALIVGDWRYTLWLQLGKFANTLGGSDRVNFEARMVRVGRDTWRM